MRTFSSLLPLVITVTTLIIFEGFSVVAVGNKNAAANSRDGRNVKATNKIQQSTIIEGSYIVRLNDKTSAAKVKTVATATATKMQTLKLQLIANGTLQATSNDVVNVPTDRIFTKSVNAFLINGVSEVMVSSLWQTAGVVSVEPNRVVSIGELRSESVHKSHVSDQQKIRQQVQTQTTPWGVQRVGGPIDLKIVPNPSGRIFVVDTGISTMTNDLIIDKTLSLNFIGTNPTAWEDDNGHGTHVAGTIAALNNGINVVGVVPGATVVALKVFANGAASLDAAIAAIEYVFINGKKGDVVNISHSTGASATYNAAVENTASLGIKFAIGAGNEAEDATNSSSASAFGTNVYTVSCYDKSDNLCSFSNYGKVVDVGGPGLYIPSLSLNGGVTTMSGTSMAAPHIAGLLFAAYSWKTDGTVNNPHGFEEPIVVYDGVGSPPLNTPSNSLQFFLVPDSDTKVDTYWELKKMSPGPSVVVASKPLGLYDPRYVWYSFVNNLAVGSYRFDLFDKSGNGLRPPAYYILSLKGSDVVLKSGGSFTNVDTTFFDITYAPSLGQSIEVVTEKMEPSPTINTARPPTVAVARPPTVANASAPTPVTKKVQKPKKK
jgi:subtilisin family serine protease